MRDDLLGYQPQLGIVLHLLELLRAQKGVARKKDEPGPALTYMSGELRERKLTVGKRAKVVLVELNGSCGGRADHL